VLSSRVVEAERGRHRTGRLLRGLAALGCAVAWLLPGRGFGTIEEQRARLPPAAECDDERVAGLWRCQIYEENYVEWSTFTLNITRDPGDPSQLRGTISNHGWDGGPGDAMPPTCDRQSGGEWSVSMDALGTVRNEHEIAFGGIGAWRLDAITCGHGPAGYNLDHFTGTIDPAILEFQSVNNDGGRAVNEPCVFRRIRCPPVASAAAPSVNPVPPAFYPSLRSGCSGLF